VTASSEIVDVPVTFPDPSNDAEVQTTSPVIPIVLAVVRVAALPSIDVMPVSDCAAEDLFSNIAVVPTYTVEFPRTIDGIVPVRFPAVRLVRFSPDTVPKEADQVPLVTVPTEVRLDETTEEPRVVALRIETLFILYSFPVAIFKSPAELITPEEFPMFTAVAAPAKFTVVAVVLARLKSEVETVRSPPSILMSPSTSKLLLILVVPDEEPISIVVAAPAKFTVVAVAFNKLNVV